MCRWPPTTAPTVALVIKDGRLVGLVSPTDVMRRLEIDRLRGLRRR
ncbi:MAG TPA: hypothetical protein VFZ70_06350 [Euzebyales bacterium]